MTAKMAPPSPEHDLYDAKLDIARENLRMACTLRKITMSEASLRAGLGRNALSQFVAGRSILSYRNILALCDVLDIPIDLLSRPDSITDGNIRLRKALAKLSTDALRDLLAQTNQ